MTLAIVLVIAAVLSLVLIVGAAVSRRSLQLSGRSNLAGEIEPVDVEAFRNLINPADDEFLRVSLPPRQFRMVRRARLQATAEYVLQAGRNAAVLVRIGQDALVSGDLRTRQAAQELINDALLLRRNAAFALLRIYTALAWPSSRHAPAGLADRYEHLSGAAMLLGRLQNPAVPVRVAARLR
jgi:hypothetical protein